MVNSLFAYDWSTICGLGMVNSLFAHDWSTIHTLGMGKHLRNMAHMRRLKRTKVLNPAALMGVLDSGVEPDKLLALFGTDPVHLTAIGYKAIATALGDELDTPHVVHVRSLTAGTLAPGRNT